MPEKSLIFTIVNHYDDDTARLEGHKTLLNDYRQAAINLNRDALNKALSLQLKPDGVQSIIGGGI